MCPQELGGIYTFFLGQSMCRNPPWLCRSAFAPRVTLSMLTFNSLLISRCGLPRLSRLMICHRSTTDASSRGVKISFRKPSTSVRLFKRVNRSQSSWKWLRFGRCICVYKKWMYWCNSTRRFPQSQIEIQQNNRLNNLLDRLRYSMYHTFYHLNLLITCHHNHQISFQTLPICAPTRNLLRR